MKPCLKLTEKLQPVQVGPTFTGEVTAIESTQQQFVIDGYFLSFKAVSLLIEPMVGDRVCFIEIEGQYYITQLLTRSNEQADLVIASKQKMQWVAPKMTFTAFEQLELVSLNKVMISSKDYVVSAAKTMLQQAESLITNVGQLSAHAKGMMKLTGKQQVIVAEKDVRIDGERINMG